MRILILLFLTLFPLFFISAKEEKGNIINLSGTWNYRLIGAPASIPGEGIIALPNTLDFAQKSAYNPLSDNTSQLRREYSFSGEATYSRNITMPQEWKNKDIYLKIERTKPAVVKLDGKIIGSNSRISSPQIFLLPENISSGNHLLEISVNNADSIPPIVARSSHAVSESTQTNWNGLLGEIILEAKQQFHITRASVEELNHAELAKISLFFSRPAPSDFKISINWKENSTISKLIPKRSTQVDIFLPLTPADLWSSQNPKLHTLDFSLTGPDNSFTETFSFTTGFRDFNTSGKNFTINGSPIFLRGTVNAAVFPLTAYAPTDIETWTEYFKTLKEYGLNHVRFHSWTPPDAAFEAADKVGFYIMVELPIWGELDRDLKFHNRFLQEELRGIMEAYNHHPSFVMFSPGNELWGEIPLMGEYMNKAKELNPRILATYGSNVYLGMNGQIGSEDFVLSAKTSDNPEDAVRGSMSFADTSTGGFFNSHYPGTGLDLSDATKNIIVPVISHEAGQYQSYPDFSEIQKYKGVLKPDNLQEFKRRAEEAGTLTKNKRYAEASGKWAAKLYKAEMEMALRSEGIGGIQLFGLQDYPGQGTASVGLLDVFMDSKGFISSEEFRQSSSDFTILAKFPKFTFTGGEKAEIPVLLADYTLNPSEEEITLKWNSGFESGEFKAKPVKGISELSSVDLKMPDVDKPKKFNFTLTAGNIKNEYDFWVYPEHLPKVKDVEVTENLQEAIGMLEKGKRVLLMPDSASVAAASLDALFVTDFWNYRMFRTICDEMHLPPSPGTLGLLVDENHPALKNFPSDLHTDWQWFSIIDSSRPLIIDRLPKDFDPIVEVIDNVERNFRLALILECNVGKGKLIILSANREKLSQYPEGRWLIQSLKEYLASKEFKPTITLSPLQLENLLTKPSNSRLIKELKNETYNSKW